MIIVGIRAAKAKNAGLTPLLKKRLRIDWPAGFGAFAITVSPPPVTAPATTAYLEASLKFGTKVARYVIAALSLNAVNIVAVIIS